MPRLLHATYKAINAVLVVGAGRVANLVLVIKIFASAPYNDQNRVASRVEAGRLLELRVVSREASMLTAWRPMFDIVLLFPRKACARPSNAPNIDARNDAVLSVADAEDPKLLGRSESRSLISCSRLCFFSQTQRGV